MPEPLTDPNTEPNARRFWRALAEYLGHACSLFGMPSVLAGRLWLGAAEHKRICAFLRVLEAILRRLIFIDALALKPAPHREPEHKRRPKRGMDANIGARFDMDNSETWRAPFNLMTTTDRRLPAGIVASARPALGQQGAISAAPSATRLEALIRGFNNRERLAEALARKLARDARAAHAYLASAPKRDRHQAGFITLVALTPLVSALYQDHLARLLNTS